MKMPVRKFFTPLVLVALTCLVSAGLLLEASAYSHGNGIATFYTELKPSACYDNKEEGVMIAAAGEALWNNGAVCGQHFQVRCLSGTNNGASHPCRGHGLVTVKIVDLCPSPKCHSTIDLSKQAFATIADPDAGVINISYQQI